MSAPDACYAALARDLGEGHAASGVPPVAGENADTSGDDLIRPDLAYEAIRMTRILARLVPDEPEVHGRLALLELTAARFPSRTGPGGEPVSLADQDRRRWDLAALRRGRAALAKAGRVGRGLGAYGLQAAIAECHEEARAELESAVGLCSNARERAVPEGKLRAIA